VAFSVRPFELTAQGVLADLESIVVKIDIPGFRVDDQICAGSLGLLEISIQSPRVAFEVGRIVVLSRVDEDPHHHAVVVGAGSADETKMAVVEGAHGGNQTD